MTPSSTRPTVALLAHRLVAPNPTGVARYVVELTRALASDPSPESPNYVAAGLAEDDEPDWVPTGMPVARVRGPRKLLSVAWNTIGRPRVDRSLGRPDLVHVLYPWSAVPAKAPLVVTLHDLIPILEPGWHTRKERWINGHGVRDAMHRATRIIADAGYIAEQIVSFGVERERIAVVPIGVGEEFFEAGHLPAEVVDEVCARFGVRPRRYFVIVGSVNVRKNVVTIVRALAKLPPPAPDDGADLLVAGPDGSASAEVAAEVDRLGLRSRVRFGGFVPGADLPALVAGGRALLHPSLDEGFGLTPVEAMAAGTPAVTSDRATLPEVVGEGGVLLPAEDPDAWAVVMARLVDDPAYWSSLRAAGRSWAERYRWRKVAAATRQVHLDALADGR